MKKNIIALTTNINRPSTRYRLLQYMPYLSIQRLSLKPAVIRKTFDRWKMFNRADQYAGVFIQKKLFSKFELAFLRKKARKVIYDYDDAIMYDAHSRVRLEVSRRYKRFQYIIKQADLIIAGNKYLAEKVNDQYSNKVIIIPTVIKTSEYPIKDYTKCNNSITLGWIGTKSTLGYLKIIEPALDKLSKKYPNMQVKVVSDTKPDIHKDYINFCQWTEDKEIMELLSFDIGLMPLPKNPWTEGKCGFKLIQYMGVGIPVVCSLVGVNRQIVQHGVNGFLAESLPGVKRIDKSWEKNISLLIENSTLRKKMGLAGRAFIEKNYNLDYWGPYLGKKLKELLD